jgi:hypothetical protein
MSGKGIDSYTSFMTVSFMRVISHVLGKEKASIYDRRVSY